MDVVVLDVNMRFVRLGHTPLIVLVRDDKRLTFVNVPEAIGKSVAKALMANGATSRPVYSVETLDSVKDFAVDAKEYIALNSKEFADDLLKACERVLGMGSGVLVKVGRCTVGENGRLSFKDRSTVALPYSAGVRATLESGYLKYGEEAIGVYANLYGIEGAVVLRVEDGEQLLRTFISGVS